MSEARNTIEFKSLDLGLQDLVLRLRAELNCLEDQNKVKAIWDVIQEGYCRECGCNDPRCQCWNDE